MKINVLDKKIHILSISKTYILYEPVCIVIVIYDVSELNDLVC